MGETLLNVGLYTIPEAARFIGVATPKLRRWVEGYRLRSDGVRRFSGPIISRDFPELVKQHILTFDDLIELKLISIFRSEGLSLQYIRSVAKFAAEKLKTNHPFAVRRFHTDGKRLFLEMEKEHGSDGELSRQRILAELPQSQLVMDEVAIPFFKKLDYEDQRVFRYWPLGREKGVVLDPKRSFGKPIDSQSGVPTFALYEMSLSGESIEAIARWYGASCSAVTAAIEYEKSLVRA
jgi:uncharacterized protein (DUF433 family)